MSDLDNYEWQVQCEDCYCTLYWTDGSVSGVTGELCSTCELERKENEVELEG